MLHYALIIITLFTSSNLIADERWYKTGGEGWYFYNWDAPVEKADEEESEEKPPVSASSSPSLSEVKPLSVEWIKQALPILRNRAIDNPTNENLMAYSYANRVMIDKATIFSQKLHQANMTNPWLREEMRYSTHPFVQKVTDSIAKTNRQSTLRKIAENSGLLFFYSSTCQFCERQAQALKIIEERYNFTTIAISIDGYALPGTHYQNNYVVDNGHAERFEIQTVPALVIMNQETAQHAFVSVGVTLAKEIEDRIIMNSRFRGWITEEEYQDTLKTRNTLIDPRFLDMADVSLDDPDTLITVLNKAVREAAKKSMR